MAKGYLSYLPISVLKSLALQAAQNRLLFFQIFVFYSNTSQILFVKGRVLSGKGLYMGCFLYHNSVEKVLNFVSDNQILYKLPMDKINMQ